MTRPGAGIIWPAAGRPSGGAVTDVEGARWGRARRFYSSVIGRGQGRTRSSSCTDLAERRIFEFDSRSSILDPRSLIPEPRSRWIEFRRPSRSRSPLLRLHFLLRCARGYGVIGSYGNAVSALAKTRRIGVAYAPNTALPYTGGRPDQLMP